ncbi:MAG TPA: hypothetical protein VE087_12605 [Xanthobacteraceae bacterium]|nr:hypothetical protein [Xanthobacteraceae bacterium]
MSNRTTIAALAAFMTVIAAPAFAADQDTATELRDSGRYVSELALPSNAYASAVTPAHFQASKQGGASRSGDFQLQGR